MVAIQRRRGVGASENILMAVEKHKNGSEDILGGKLKLLGEGSEDIWW